MEKYFNVWNGFSLICPDLKDDERFFLVGDSSEMVSSKYSFQIEACNNKTVSELTNGRVTKCKMQSEIDAKVNQVQLDTWQLYNQMDYTLMTDDPLFKVQKIVQSMPLKSDVYFKTVMTFRQHYVKLIDKYL